MDATREGGAVCSRTDLLIAAVVLDDLDGVGAQEDLLVFHLLAQRVPQVVAPDLMVVVIRCDV